MPARSNLRLPPLPDPDDILRMVAVMEQERRYRDGVPAGMLAHRLDVEGARRAGSGAKDGRSWTGTMSPSIRLAPRLATLARAGLLLRWRADYRWWYCTTDEGRKRISR